MKKLTSMILAVIMMLSIAAPTTAFAAADVSPYVFNWADSTTKLQHVQLYEYDSVQNVMCISDRVAIDGNSLYDMSGNLICNDLKSWTDNQPTVAINTSGLFFISKDGEIRKMTHSTEQTYATTEYTASYFELDAESLALNARSGRTSKALKDLTFSGNNKRKDDPVVTKGAYVKSEAYEGDPEKIAYKAYSKDKLFLTTLCKASNVWQQDFQKLLSSTCKGAKFCGYLGDYTILIYDMNKTVYSYQYSDGFSKATKILKGEMVYQFLRNDAGFVTTIVTDKGTHDVSKAVTVPTKPVPTTPTNPGNPTNPDTKDAVTSVRNFVSKAMAYNGTNLVGTLAKSEEALTWKGMTLANSKGCVDFGVTKSGNPVWILSNGYVYTYQDGVCGVLAQNGSQLNFDADGRVTAFQTTGNKVVEI